MSLLKENTTIEVLTNDRITGYVYADAVQDGVQRVEWVLFNDFQFVNDAPMSLRAVTDEAWNHDSLAAFVAHVQAVHNPGAGWEFCHARATVTEHPQARTYDLKPGLPPDDFQMEIDKGIALLSAGNEPRGMCYARKQNGATHPDVEYWHLASDCPLVPDGTITVQELAEPVTMSIARTVKIANRYDQTPPQI